MKNIRQVLLLLITAAILAGALAYSFHVAGTDALISAFKNAKWQYAPLAVILGLLVYPIKALRWRVILGRENTASLRTLFAAIMIGFMANCIVSRVGELIRAAVIALKGEMRASRALASIALERVFDVCTVLLFLVIALMGMNPQGSGEAAQHLATLRKVGAGATVVLAFAILFLIVLRLKPDETIRLLLRTTLWLPARFRAKIEDVLGSFLLGLNTIHSAPQLAAVMALSLIHWFVQVLFFWAAAMCFPQLGLGLLGAMLVFAVTGLGVAGVPLPGYIGIYQASVIAAGAIIGASATDTGWISYSWLSWALNIPFVIVVGFICLWREKLSWGQLRRQGTPGT